MAEGFDLVVIGGGSGGLAAAQRAAEHGARVVLVEPDALGGTCVNRGCVPKKIMWNAAELGSALHDARDYGFSVEERGLDWPLLRARRDAYIERLNGIYAANLAKRNVELIRARAAFLDAHNVSAGGRTPPRTSWWRAAGGRSCRRSPAPSSGSPPTDSSRSTRGPGVSRSSAAATSASSWPVSSRASARTPRWCC